MLKDQKPTILRNILMGFWLTISFYFNLSYLIFLSCIHFQEINYGWK